MGKNYEEFIPVLEEKFGYKLDGKGDMCFTGEVDFRFLDTDDEDVEFLNVYLKDGSVRKWSYYSIYRELLGCIDLESVKREV